MNPELLECLVSPFGQLNRVALKALASARRFSGHSRFSSLLVIC